MTTALRENLSELALLAEDHISKSNGMLSPLPINPEDYPEQASHVIYGSPQPKEVVDGVATVAEPSYVELISQLNTKEQEDRISGIAEELNEGRNVIIATNHGKLIDIAITQAAIYSKLKERNTSFR